METAEAKDLDEVPTDKTTERHKPHGRSCPRGEHYFVHVSGVTAECRKCRIGFYLTPDCTVEDGHIVAKGRLLI